MKEKKFERLWTKRRIVVVCISLFGVVGIFMVSSAMFEGVKKDRDELLLIQDELVIGENDLSLEAGNVGSNSSTKVVFDWNPPNEQSKMERVKNELKAREEINVMSEHLAEISDYYGGVYVDENGYYVVCVTPNCPQNSRLIQEQEQYEYVKIRYVDYTREKLLQVQEQIHQRRLELYEKYKDNVLENRVSEEYELMLSIIGQGLDESKNSVVVYIKELNENKIQLFKKIFTGEGCIEFQVGGDFSYTVEYQK